MPTFSWLVSSPDKQYKVDVDQNAWTGALTIKVDGQQLDKSAITKAGRVREFLIGGQNAALKIKGGLGPNLELTVGEQVVPLLNPPLAMPWWGWLCVVACVAIPVVTLGGALPAGIGIGGAAGVYTVARNPSMSASLRFLACLGIVIICWGLLLALGLAAFRLFSR